MKTKLTFFCTHCQYGGFEKVIFETVLDGKPFESTYDAREWIDARISEFCDDFDFELVFEWVVMNFEETAEEISPVTIKKTLSGKLVFKGEKTKKVKPKLTKTKKVKVDPAPIPEPKKVDYASVWIDPFGKSYKVGFACHEEFASDWLRDHDTETVDRNDRKLFGQYHYEILQDRGWARILGWTKTPTFVLPTKIGPKLKTAVKDYCLSYGLDFPERLKS
jgi:hypothetical protein